MERKERRHHTREFKLEAVRLAAVGDKTKAKVARELGVRVNQLRQWRLDFEEEERNGVPKQELATAEQDVGKLRRENALLREENELLKKAAIYFAKVSRCGTRLSIPSAAITQCARCAERCGYRPAGITPAAADHQAPGRSVSRP